MLISPTFYVDLEDLAYQTMYEEDDMAIRGAWLENPAQYSAATPFHDTSEVRNTLAMHWE